MEWKCREGLFRASYRVYGRIDREHRLDRPRSDCNRRLNLRFDETQPNVWHRDFHFGKLYRSRSISPVWTESEWRREFDGTIEGAFDAETDLLSQFVEHACAHSSGVCTENILLRFFELPIVLITNRSEGTGRVNLLHFSQILFGELGAHRWIRQEESILSISGWMLLRSEEGIEIPETVLHVAVGGHLREPRMIRTEMSDGHGHRERSTPFRERSVDIRCELSTADVNIRKVERCLWHWSCSVWNSEFSMNH